MLSTTITSSVKDSLSKVGFLGTGSPNATVAPENSVVHWTMLKELKSVECHRPYLVVKSAGDLNTQSTPKFIQPVCKEHKDSRRISTP